MNTKKISLFAGICTCVGITIGSSNMLVIANGVSYCGVWFIIPLVISCCLCLLCALTFTELRSIMPQVEGGIGQYVYVGMGSAASISSQLASTAGSAVCAMAVEAAMCGYVLNEFMPLLSIGTWSIIIIVLIAVVNWFGVSAFAKLQEVSVAFLFVTLFTFGFLGAFRFGINPVVDQTMQEAPAYGGVNSLFMVASGAWLFMGSDAIIPIANDMKNPKKNVLRSMVFGLLILLLLNILLSIGMHNYVGTSDLLSSDIPHLIYANAVLGKFGRMWMSISILFASVTTLNTCLENTSVMFYGMAESKLIFKALGKLNKHHAPYLGIFLLSGLQIIIILLGLTGSDSLTMLISAASCCNLLCYILANITIFIMRKREPEKAWKLPKVCNLVQIIAIVGLLYLFLTMGEEDSSVYVVALLLMAVSGIYAIIWSVAKMKVNPFKGVPIEAAIGDAAVEKEDLS